MHAAPAHRCRRRPPFFHPVPLRARHDGWSEERQCGFLAQLYLTGSVAMAARKVGMTRASAYRLRARDDAQGFAAAWDYALVPPGSGRVAAPGPDWRKVTQSELLRRIETGLVRPVIYRGRVLGLAHKPDNSALLRLLRRCDARSPDGRLDGSPGQGGSSGKHPGLCDTGPGQSVANTSYPSTAAATAALRLSARPFIGIVTRRSHAASYSAGSPCDSLPTMTKHGAA